ncbi:MAG: hypothetical protein K2W95_18690 [Candidatus Obscuribacterales bacterium]|nr:hypothetical protein [Candidatus Obscuribacterales bacterium]
MKFARSRYHGIATKVLLFAVLSGALAQQAYALEPGVGAEVRIESQRSLANAIADLKKNPGLTEASFDVSTNAQIKMIAELPQIRTLNLYVRTDNLDLSPLQHLRNLEKLNLALFNQTSAPDKWLSVLPRLRSLRSLELYHSQPTNAVKKRIAVLPAMPKLQTLSLKSFGDTVYDFAPSFDSSKLLTLELAAPAIANQAVMSKFNKLESLILGNSFKLNNSGKVALQQVKTLRHLAAPRAENLPLESWSHLRSVTLGDTSAIDLVRLSKLQQLESITTKLQKDCTDSHLLRLAQLHALKSLDVEAPSHFENGNLVASTKLTGSGLAALSAQNTLTKLTVRGLALSEPLLTAVSNINSLRSLEITVEEVALTPALAKHLNKLKNLEELAVAWPENGMIAVLKECPGLTKLTSLQLRKQNLKDGDLSILSNYPAVTRLDLSENNLTDDCLRVLSTMTHLSELQLSGNKAITAKTFGALANLPSLKSLFLNNTAITDDAMRAIKLNTSALTLLDLSQTSVGKQALSAITTLPKLKRLALSGTPITDASINSLRSRTLEELKLDSTEITEHGMRDHAKAAHSVSLRYRYQIRRHDACLPGSIKAGGLVQLQL